MTRAQWSQLQQAVQERSEGAVAMAANLLQIDAERRRPHCQSGGAVRRGTTLGLRRYSCKRCGQTFTAPSGTALSGAGALVGGAGSGAAVGAPPGRGGLDGLSLSASLPARGGECVGRHPDAR